MVLLLQILVILAVTVFITVNLVYLANTVLAVTSLREVSQEVRRSVASEVFTAGLTPGVSILVPTLNEEVAIVDAVQSLLALRYPTYEIIVLDGGSTDRTRERLIDEFAMVPAQRASRQALRTGVVDAYFVSTRYPDLWLACKPEKGRSDALNAGVNTARHEFIAQVDGDAFLEPDALMGAVQPVVADPDAIGTGGMIRPVNGSVVENGRVVSVRFPRTLVASLQVPEYMRSFLITRTPLSRVGAVPIISGAFGLYRRDLVEAVGGYFAATSADDAEIVLHLYRYTREQGRVRSIVFRPEPVCWTEVPETMRTLMQQRRRWHRGIAEVLWRHRKVVFRRKYGRLGWVATPYLLAELAGPPVELLAWGLVILAAVLGVLSVPALLVFLGVSFSLQLVMSLATIILGEVEYRRKVARFETVRLLGFAMLEYIGYRQLVSVACLAGLVDFLRGRQRYVQPTRRGLSRG